jgi:hypothetical protein
MANLPTAQSSGQQTTTQDPQSATTQTVGASTQSAGVQPGTASALLNSTSGVGLTPTALTTVAFNPTTQAQTIPETPPVRHQTNYVLYGMSIVLCLAAIVLFWATTNSAKNTTK